MYQNNINLNSQKGHILGNKKRKSSLKGIDWIIEEHLANLNKKYGRVMLINMLSSRVKEENLLKEELEDQFISNMNDMTKFKNFDFYENIPNINDLTNIFKFVHDFDTLRSNFGFSLINFNQEANIFADLTNDDFFTNTEISPNMFKQISNSS